MKYERNPNEEILIVSKGRFKGKEFRVEGCVDEDLSVIAEMGNMAALNAVTKDKYTLKDVPFYYGKIDGLGYIISENDIGTKPATKFVMPRYY